MRIPALLASCLAIAACGGDSSNVSASGDSGPPQYVVTEWVLPSSPGSAQPNLVATDDGRLLLTWINSVAGRRNALRFAALGENGRWSSEARTVVVGDALMANWADVPHITAAADGALWVHWLQKAGGDGYAADIALSRSVDGGFNWAAPVKVNDDDVVAEHGFAALWPMGPESVGIAWLDGRNNVAPADHEMAHGRTELRAAVFDRNFARSGEAVVDPMTCDCCQTDLAITAKGPLLVYRDRTEDEIRDIVAVRLVDGAWTAPKPVHADNWHMTACPVNGPSVAADGNDVVAAWYTAADDKPRVLLSRSGDAGDSWGAPVMLDEGGAVQGRVAVALDDDQAWALWVREDKTGQSLWLSRRSADLAKELQRLQVAKLQGRGKATGFPQLALHHGNAYLVWTDIVDRAPHLRGAIVAQPEG
ncbi:MAG: exo-alpha-sialidase [Lysobacteraceae bacterium]|nr:MAG: exo-alpha-sialidase [Xanthomonadaceae bacterium]